MTVTAASAPPTTPVYVVDEIRAIGNGLWQLTVRLPNRSTVRIVLKLSNLTLQNVVLSAEAIGTLAATKNGATPVLRPIR